MATRRFCDRCDKQLPPGRTNKHITMSERATNIDLCDTCFIQLQNWLKPDTAKVIPPGPDRIIG